MKNSLKIESRLQCAVCGHPEFVKLRKIEAFPVLPICTDGELTQDHLASLDFVLCDTCGCLQLQNLVDRSFIYSSAHSEGIGGTWANHYVEFLKFILKSAPLSAKIRALEVGAGQGQLVNQLAPKCQLTVVEPNYGGPKAGIEVRDGFFSVTTFQEEKSSYDVVYSSHTLEHFYDFREYFESAAHVLKKGGLLLTAVPNLESALQAGYANAINFEHTAMLTLPHLLRLHREFGFEVKGISYYRDHGIYLSAEKTDCKEVLSVDTREYMGYLFNKFMSDIEVKKLKVEKLFRSGRSHFLFGASQFSQFLFSCGLSPAQFEGLLDNAQQKNKKRLYGTPLQSRLPGEALREVKEAQIFINGGPYTPEIYEQLKNIGNKESANWELICL